MCCRIMSVGICTVRQRSTTDRSVSDEDVDGRHASSSVVCHHSSQIVARGPGHVLKNISKPPHLLLSMVTKWMVGKESGVMVSLV